MQKQSIYNSKLFDDIILTGDAEAIVFMSKLKEKYGIVSEYVFAENEPIKKTGLLQHLIKICSNLVYKITNNHAFRKTLNSNVFIPMGLTTKQRAELLGHSMRVNEEHYSHILKTDIANIGQQLDNFKKIKILVVIWIKLFQSMITDKKSSHSNIFLGKNKQSLANSYSTRDCP